MAALEPQLLVGEPARRFACFRAVNHSLHISRRSYSPQYLSRQSQAAGTRQRGLTCAVARPSDASLTPALRRVEQQKVTQTPRDSFLRLGLAAAGAYIAAAGVQAVVGQDLALAAAGVPEAVAGATSAVSDAVAPVATKANAFIPGLIGDSPLREGIVSGFLLILFSELGDKTFFLALLLALKESKGLVFAGTFGALAVMTVISVALGQLLHQLDELEFAGSQLPLDDLLAVALLLFFGIKTILDARTADESAAEEREEAEEEVSKFNSGAAGLVLSTFALVFAAEWGDKSFLATIALAAASSPTGVVIGAIAGHGFATGIAVLGGSYLGKYLDEKVVQYVGGSLFLLFAGATIVDIIRGV